MNAEAIQENIYESMLQVLTEKSANTNVECPLFLPDCVYKV